MQGVYIEACKRGLFDITQAVAIENAIAMRGSDQFGKFTMYGTGVIATTGTTVSLSKIYDYQQNPLIRYKGSVVSGVVSGQWEWINEPNSGSEFRMYPKGTVFNEDIPLYGKMCQYPANWKGAVIMQGSS